MADAVGATSANSATSAALQAGNLGLQDFLKILLTQLTYQDPLKPMDNKDFLAQMAQFTMVAQVQQMNDKIDRGLAAQSSGQSVGLLGRTVDVSTSGGLLSGTVTSIALTSEGPKLTVRSSSGAEQAGITLDQVQGVR